MYNQYNPYNPYNSFIGQQKYQSIETPMNYQNNSYSQNKMGLNGKQVESVEIAKNQEVLLDGSISYYPLLDNSAILTKQLQTDGTTKTIIYKPVKDEGKEEKYLTSNDLKNLQNEFEELREEMDNLKKKLKKKEE